MPAPLMVEGWRWVEGGGFAAQMITTTRGQGGKVTRGQGDKVQSTKSSTPPGDKVTKYKVQRTPPPGDKMTRPRRLSFEPFEPEEEQHHTTRTPTTRTPPGRPPFSFFILHSLFFILYSCAALYIYIIRCNGSRLGANAKEMLKDSTKQIFFVFSLV